MENEIIIALIGLTGIIFGALITALVQYMSSKQKLRKLQISYSQKTYEKLIESARNHLDDLYLPLYKEISSLLYQYTQYRNIYRIAEASGHKSQEVEELLEKLLDSIVQFDETVENIFKKGMTAYLVGSVEDRLIDLRDLLNQSRKEPFDVVQQDVTTSFSSNLVSTSHEKFAATQLTFKILSNLREILAPIPILYVPQIKIETKILKAPLYSDVFDKQFMDYIIEIKREIREVTLWLKP